MSHYFSLISSLPMLKIGEETKITLSEFLESAEQYVHGKEMEDLRNFRLIPNETFEFEKNSLAAQYTAWELALRHSILKIRSTRKNKFPLVEKDGSKRDSTFECDADASAVTAYNAANPLERERLLDRARWTKAEELEQGHIFDMSVLQSYCIRLQLCEKWQKRVDENALSNFDRALDAISPNNGETN